MPAGSTLTCMGIGAIAFTQPVSIIELKKSRAMAENPAVAREGDILQDMGSGCKKFRLEGLCTRSEKISLEQFIDAPQITDTYPSGRCSITQTDDAGNVQVNITQLSMSDLVLRYRGGLPQRWYFLLDLIRADQS